MPLHSSDVSGLDGHYTALFVMDADTSARTFADGTLVQIVQKLAESMWLYWTLRRVDDYSKRLGNSDELIPFPTPRISFLLI